MLGEPLLQPPDKQLFGPAQQRLEVLGQYQGHLAYKGRETRHQLFVVNHLKLGLLAISALHLAARIESTTSCHVAVTEETIKKKA